MMRWDSDLYQEKHDFVAEYGKGLVEWIPEKPGQLILDLGCGTGILTQELWSMGYSVIGADSSPEMIVKARSLYPHIEFQVLDACELPWDNRFDVIFSNAVFHWILTPEKLLHSVYRTLKNGGRLICEFGGEGNISTIQNSFENKLNQLGQTYSSPFFYPSDKIYSSLLAQAGFQVERLYSFDRPTPLKNGADGLRNWVKQFFTEDLNRFTPAVQEKILAEMEEQLRPCLWDGTQWVADYRRLRVHAVKP